MHCSNGADVDAVRKEMDVLHGAVKWRHCVGRKGFFWAPQNGEDGLRRGTTYHFAMQCAACPPRWV